VPPVRRSRGEGLIEINCNEVQILDRVEIKTTKIARGQGASRQGCP